MKVVINTKTGEVSEEQYTPPTPTQEEVKEKRIIEILTELEELDKKVDRVDEDIIEEMYKEFGYMPYTTTAEVINHKEDLRDELKLLKKQEVQDEGDN